MLCIRDRPLVLLDTNRKWYTPGMASSAMLCIWSWVTLKVKIWIVPSLALYMYRMAKLHLFFYWKCTRTSCGVFDSAITFICPWVTLVTNVKVRSTCYRKKYNQSRVVTVFWCSKTGCLFALQVIDCLVIILHLYAPCISDDSKALHVNSVRTLHFMK